MLIKFLLPVSLLADLTVSATPEMNCPQLCPLQRAQYTCSDLPESGASYPILQWRLWGNGFFGILSPTTNEPITSETLDGVQFTAEGNKSFLLLYFTAELVTETINIICCDVQVYPDTCDNCTVMLSGNKM